MLAVIGPSTYSSGEALAWALQHERLAKLVGRATRGAADHVVPLALTHDVSVLIPEATVMPRMAGAPGRGQVSDLTIRSVGEDEPLDPELLDRINVLRPHS